MADKPDQFTFLPGEQVFQICGWPGPDTDACEIIADDGGDTVRVRFQVYGKGPFLEMDVPRKNIVWKHGSATSERFNAFKENR